MKSSTFPCRSARSPKQPQGLWFHSFRPAQRKPLRVRAGVETLQKAARQVCVRTVTGDANGDRRRQRTPASGIHLRRIATREPPNVVGCLGIGRGTCQTCWDPCWRNSDHHRVIPFLIPHVRPSVERWHCRGNRRGIDQAGALEVGIHVPLVSRSKNQGFRPGDRFPQSTRSDRSGQLNADRLNRLLAFGGVPRARRLACRLGKTDIGEAFTHPQFDPGVSGQWMILGAGAY